jgi:beta-barrel assembly-enhancing protease
MLCASECSLHQTQTMKSAPRFLTAFAVVFALSCGSGSNFNLISMEEEWQLGQQLSQDIARQVRLVNDPSAQAYIDQMGQKLVAQTSMANMPWQFHIVQDPAINAFAIPGGHVYVNTGLINVAANASELAGVLGHEINHVVARHSTEQISRQYGVQVLGGIILGQNPSALQQLAAQIIAGGAMARYSRADEDEADKLGLQTMNAAGYNPQGMVTMFQKLLANQKSNPSSVEQFFSSHPLTEDRIRKTQSRIKDLPQRSTVTDEPGFQSLKSRV